MIDLIKAAPIIPAVIAYFQCLHLCNAPVYQWVLLVFDALRLICRDTDIMERLILALEPVDLFVDEVRFELTSTPSDFNTGPAVAVERNAQLFPIFNGGRLLLFLLEHQVFKAFGMAERCQVNTALTIEMLVQFCQMFVHLRKLHAGIRCQHHVDGHPPVQHEQQHGRTVLAARKGYRVKYLLVESNHLRVLIFPKQLYNSAMNYDLFATVSHPFIMQEAALWSCFLYAVFGIY